MNKFKTAASILALCCLAAPAMAEDIKIGVISVLEGAFAGSFARRAAAFARSSFVGTWRCCWRFRIRNCLNASWSDGPSLSSAS